MISHTLPNGYVPELEDEALTSFVQSYSLGESWPFLQELTGLSKYRMENLVLYYDLGSKTSFYKKKISGVVAHGLRTDKGELYLNNVHPSHIAADFRGIYKIGEET